MSKSVEQRDEIARYFDPASVPALDGEEWRPVPGFEGAYMVSNFGRFLSLERRCVCSQGTRRVRQRIRKPTRIIDKRSGSQRVTALQVSLSYGETKAYAYIGRLVLLAFIGDQPGMVAHYKDGDPTNVHLTNLEWSTYSAISVANGSLPPWAGKRWPSQRQGVPA